MTSLTNKHQSEIAEAWDRFLDNTYTCDDLSLILDAFKGDEYLQEFHNGLYRIWNATKDDAQHLSEEEKEAYRIEAVQLRAEYERKMQIRQLKSLKYSLFRKIGYAAAILLPFTILSYFTYCYFTIEPAPDEPPLWSELIVPSGSKMQMSLQDGTKVWLNADSRLRYDSKFGRTNRSVHLSGEAYFEVAKNEQSPFIVDVGELKIKVTGTHFNVNAYSENHGVSVALIEGAVEMIAGKNAIVLKPGNTARYDATTGKVAVALPTVDKPVATAAIKNNGATLKQSAMPLKKSAMPFKIEDAIAWKDNRLLFNGESFEQIISSLERTFNVIINVKNEQVKKRRFHGDFINNETIEQIITVMAINGHFKYQIKGNVIDIY